MVTWTSNELRTHTCCWLLKSRHIVTIFDYNIEGDNDKICESVTAGHRSAQMKDINVIKILLCSVLDFRPCVWTHFFLPHMSSAPRRRTTTCCRKSTLSGLTSVGWRDCGVRRKRTTDDNNIITRPECAFIIAK